MNNLTYSEITSLAGQLKTLSSQINEVIQTINLDYKRIGDGGDIWTGDAADTARDTFDELTSKFPDFANAIDEFADYLVSVVAQR